MKKVLGCFITVALLLVNLGLVSFAVDLGSLSINQIEASGDGVVIYPSSPVDASTLAANVELFQNGVMLNDIVCSKIETIGPTPFAYKSTWAKPDSYIIKPASGMVGGSVFQLRIKQGLINSVGTQELKADYNKVFRLDNLLYDDFSTYSETNPVTGAWTYVQLSYDPKYQGSATQSIENGAWKIVTGPSNTNNIPFVSTQYANQKAWRDYTVEFDFTPVNRGSSENYCNTSFFTDKPSNIITIPGFYMQANGIRLYSGTSDYGWQNVTLTDANTSGSLTTYHIKFAMNAKHYQAFVDGKKVLDYTNPTGCDTVGAPQFNLKGDNATYKFDNIRITKMTEILDTVGLDSLGLTNSSGDSVTSVAGLQTVSGTIQYHSLYANPQPCKMVVASFADGMMKNALVLPDTALQPGSNSTGFENFALNGGTTLKLFLLNGFTDIKPYCAPIAK